MNGIKGRKKAKLDLLRMIREYWTVLDQRTILGKYSLKTGLSVERLKRYVAELEDAGLIKDQGEYFGIPGKKREE